MSHSVPYTITFEHKIFDNGKKYKVFGQAPHTIRLKNGQTISIDNFDKMAKELGMKGIVVERNRSETTRYDFRYTVKITMQDCGVLPVAITWEDIDKYSSPGFQEMVFTNTRYVTNISLTDEGEIVRTQEKI